MVVSSRSTADKVREGTMVSIHPGREWIQLGDLIATVVGKILASERLQRRQDSTNETITPKRRHQSQYRTSADPAKGQRFPRVMLLHTLSYITTAASISCFLWPIPCMQLTIVHLQTIARSQPNRASISNKPPQPKSGQDPRQG